MLGCHLHSGDESQGGRLVDERLCDRVLPGSVVEHVLVKRRADTQHRSAARLLERLAHAELVALGVEHLDPFGVELGQAAVRHPGRSEPFEAVRLGLDVGRRDVHVHAVLGRLRLVHPLQQQPRTAPVTVAKHRVLRRRTSVLVAERRGPEPGHHVEVGTVQDELDVHGAILASPIALKIWPRFAIIRGCVASSSPA